LGVGRFFGAFPFFVPFPFVAAFDPHRLGPRVAGLVTPSLPPPGSETCVRLPTGGLDRRARHALRRHLRDEGLDVVAHQKELVLVVLLRRVHRHLARRQAEDEPAAAGVDSGEAEHVAKECAIRVRIPAVDDRVGSRQHGDLLIVSWYGERRRAG
jgi:hypothetical protein